MSRQLPLGRWSFALFLSVLLCIADLIALIIGLFLKRAPLWLFGIAGLGPSSAAISVGWALDFRLPAMERRWRIRAMHWFFNLTVGTCLVLAMVDVVVLRR